MHRVERGPRRLRKGGKPLLIFLGLVLGFLVLQNVTGVVLALMLDQSPFFGLLAGSVSLSGGHGTGVAWGKVFTEKFGIVAAAEVALALPILGLLLGQSVLMVAYARFAPSPC